MPKRKTKIERQTHIPLTTTCQSKQPFRTEREALESAEFGMLQDMTIDLGVYRCTICNQWHKTRIKK